MPDYYISWTHTGDLDPNSRTSLQMAYVGWLQKSIPDTFDTIVEELDEYFEAGYDNGSAWEGLSYTIQLQNGEIVHKKGWGDYYIPPVIQLYKSPIEI